MESTDRQWHPGNRVGIAAADAKWRMAVGALCDDLGAIAFNLPVRDLLRGQVPVNAWLHLIPLPGASAVEQLEAISLSGSQPVTVLSVSTGPGSRGLSRRAAELGFEEPLHRLPDSVDEVYWETLELRLRDRMEHRLWLIPPFRRALNCTDRVLVEALAVLCREPRTRTVESWGRTSGHGDRDEIEHLHRGLGLPAPKRLLVFFRLAHAVCEKLETGAVRDEIADKLAYPNGDYLGKQCRHLTGGSFADIVAGGLPVLLSHVMSMARRRH